MFEKGQSGNPGGRPKVKPFKDALMLVLREDEDDPETSPRKDKLRAIASQLVSKAIDGDVTAIKEIGDRIDGKSVQQSIVSGDEDGGPVRFQRIERVVIDPANPNATGVPAALTAG